MKNRRKYLKFIGAVIGGLSALPFIKLPVEKTSDEFDYYVYDGWGEGKILESDHSRKRVDWNNWGENIITLRIDGMYYFQLQPKPRMAYFDFPSNTWRYFD